MGSNIITRRRRAAALLAAGGMLVMGSPVLTSPAGATPPPDEESTLRIGVLALTGAISAVGQTPELATPLPFTTTSLADVLGLDASLTSNFDAALQGNDLEAALELVEGIEVVDDGDDDTIAFTYERTVTEPLALVHDDGDLRFGTNSGAGNVTVSLSTHQSDPFVVAIDPDQPDPLLRVALVSQPVMDLAVDIDRDSLTRFNARQGFTDVRVTGGRYRIHRDQVITMRDPDGRGLLTLEDLRYSTLPDLFRVETGTNTIDVGFDLALPDSLSGGTTEDRTGTMDVTASTTPDGGVWPSASNADRTYGAKLAQATGLSMVDGLTSLAQYTGTVLALQDAADVPFPNLGGGTSDLFAPGDRLLELLSTAAAAQVVCGLSPENPPTGTAAPGDTVYCQATTAQGLGTLTDVTWSLKDSGTIVGTPPATAVGQTPEGLVEISGSDGEPDLEVSFTAQGQQLTARSMPHTVQDVVSRIGEITGSSASASLGTDRLDVAVDISQATSSKQLSLGNPGALGALVGLTGLSSADPDNPAKATASATGNNFDVGFAVQTGDLDEGEGRATYLVPKNASLLTVDGLSATAPAGVTGLDARIGFLGVKADLTGLSLGKNGSEPAVELSRVSGGSAPFLISDLLNEDGALDPDLLDLDSRMTASIAFTAKEQPLPGVGGYATGVAGGASGEATVAWNPGGLPAVTFGSGYEPLRVFDPVPASFVSGTTVVSGSSVSIEITSLPSDTTLFRALNVPAEPGVEVARRLVTEGAACQNVTVVNADTLTCEELAPEGKPVFEDGEAVSAIVLGDPFAMRDSVIEGLATALAGFDRLAGDNRDEGLAFDQYTSSLPLVDLTPGQLALERQALRQGLAAIDAAATADEQGVAGTPVSSAQELATAVTSLVKQGTATGFSPSLAYDLGTDLLGVRLRASAPAGSSLVAPLRLDDVGTVGQPGRGQVMSGMTGAGNQATVSVGVASTTTLAITVDRSTARPAIGDDTGTESTATLSRTGGLTGHPLAAGITELAAQDGSSAHLGVNVVTDYVPGTDGGQLQTTRSNSRAPADAAKATLVVGADDTIEYAALATDSSGGTGATQPAPDPMQVKFLAEGLDGLATALGSAMDGAAPRNLGPDGAPISAPLIGTDLDAGAGVPDLLTDLTSALRDELEGDAITDATDAATLADELDDAVSAAVGKTGGLDGVPATGVDVEITCDTGDSSCSPCPEPTADDPEPACTTDGPTNWEAIEISTTLSGSTTGEIQFDTGLAGLEVRSIDTVATTTSWTLPVTLRLERGVGPQVVVGGADALELDVTATMPGDGIEAIVGYLPATLTADGDAGKVDTTIVIAPEEGTYDLFDLYDGELGAVPGFSGDDEEGITLDFATMTEDHEGQRLGTFALAGDIDIPWGAADGFTEDVSYNDVTLDVGTVAKTVATPFAVVDPYLAPVRDVIDVLRTPIPVISTLSELAGGDEVSLLSLLETLSAATEKPQLELAHRVIGLVGGVTDVVAAIAPLADGTVLLEDLSDFGALLTVDPSDVSLYEKCTETVSTSTTVNGTTTTKKTAPKPCPGEEDLAADQDKAGAAGQTTADNRTGNRKVKEKVAQRTREITGQLPGFSLPFLSDPDQLIDVLTGEGEASYFRIDLGTLAAQVAYSAKFGPIMAGPVPIVPFVGGSISVEGRLAMGFDSYAQTLAAKSVNPGDVDALLDRYADFDGGDVIREGFYIDDLDAEGEDVPEVKLVTTLEAGAGVSIGIVTAGLKGGVTLTINLDLNDPDDDGRLRTAEIRTMFAGDPACIFDASAEIEAFISIFVEIELLLTSLEYEFDILRLGPYTLFEYGCPDVEPSLVVQSVDGLTLTSGDRASDRLPGSGSPFEIDGSDDFEVRQFDRGSGVTRYEVSGLGRVQLVDVTRNSATSYDVTIYKSGLTISAEESASFHLTSKPTFEADGGNLKDQISFLTGEEFAEDEEGELALATTPFTTAVTRLSGGADDDTLVTGDADDRGVDGEEGNDSIDTGLGDDVVTGGLGDDVVGGGAGRDDVKGGDGNDRLEGGPGGDRVNGEAGGDSLVGGPGRDVRALLVRPNDAPDDVVTEQVRLGFDSGDVLVGGSGGDTVDGGDGSDVVAGGEAASLTGVAMGTLFKTGIREVNLLVEGPSGGDNELTTEDVPIDTAKTPTPAELDDLCVSGTEVTEATTSDFVTGGPEGDIVVGGNAADTLDGGGGPDELCGRAGDDQISGDGAEDDDENDDVIRGGTGNDRADGGPGEDVMFGDDVTLVRDGERFVNGSLGGSDDHTGAGTDYLDGGDGGDVIAGGEGSDLLLGGLGDDATYGEGRDTTTNGGEAPGVDQRLLACNQTTRVVRGLIDLDGDLFAGAGGDGLTADTGQLAGLDVTNGVLGASGSSAAYEGLLGSDVVVIGGQVDLDLDGDATDDADDTGFIAQPSMLGTGSNTQGDCVLGGDGNDELRGGAGSDYLGSGDGTDLGDGGDGNDLLLGDDGTDVLLGGPHHDVVVGGTGDDHLQGENGDDRLRGNEGADDLVGGSDTSAVGDGQDVLLGGREEDVLVAENGVAVSQAIIDKVTVASVPWTSLAPQAVHPDDTSDLVFEDSAVQCDSSTPTRWLTTLVGDGVDGVPAPSPGTGDLAYDELYGGYDCDLVIGSTGTDLVRGGQDDDLVEGGPGSDFGYGDDGDDVVVGGSTLDPTEDSRFTTDRDGSGVADGGDTLRGDGGPDAIDGDDLVVGDNAHPVGHAAVGLMSGPAYVVELSDLGDATIGGNDDMRGDGGADRMFGQHGADAMAGDAGTDYLEGNTGIDSIWGGDEDDDIIGGSSDAQWKPFGRQDTDEWPMRLVSPIDERVDASAAGVPDDKDVVHAGAGNDTVLGDNGRITRPFLPLSGPVPDMAMADTSVAATSGSDELHGDDGDDVLVGQLDAASTLTGGTALKGGDALSGGDGDDTLVGDLAVVARTVPPATATLTVTGTLIREVVNTGTYVPKTYVPAGQARNGGPDVGLGGSGNDTLFMGGGADLANGDDGLDTLFGGDGNDGLWGGADHDRLFGGYGADKLDLKYVPSNTSPHASVASPVDKDGKPGTVNDDDLIYGGYGPDEMQADVGGTGRSTGSDQLIDWVGAYNLYYVCNGAYGQGKVFRESSPSMVDMLTRLASASGTQEMSSPNSGGWFDLGLVKKSDIGANNGKHPLYPGNNTCG